MDAIGDSMDANGRKAGIGRIGREEKPDLFGLERQKNRIRSRSREIKGSG